MTTKTKTLRTWKTERAALSSTVAWISQACNVRAFDALVVQINKFGTGEKRSIVLKTGTNKNSDIARCQRMCRRLRAIGVKITSDAPSGRSCDGLFGTMFAYKV